MINISKNGAALLILVLSILGLEFSETEIQSFIAAIVQVVSFLLMVYNQLDRKNVKWFLFKNKD